MGNSNYNALEGEYENNSLVVYCKFCNTDSHDIDYCVKLKQLKYIVDELYLISNCKILKTTEKLLDPILLKDNILFKLENRNNSFIYFYARGLIKEKSNIIVKYYDKIAEVIGFDNGGLFLVYNFMMNE